MLVYKMLVIRCLQIIINAITTINLQLINGKIILDWCIFDD